MARPNSPAELNNVRFKATAGSPQATPGVAEVTIPITLSCPAGVAQTTDRPFVRVQRTDGKGVPKGLITLLEDGQPEQGSEVDKPLVLQLAKDAMKSASNLWFFSISLAPLPGNVFVQVFAGYSEAMVRSGDRDVLAYASLSALRVQTPKQATPEPIVQVLTPGPVPRLCVGLNSATPPPLRQNEFTGSAASALQHNVETISKIVRHIAERVRQPLDAVWTAQGAKPLPLTPTFPDTPEGIADANEFWARQVTEMAAFTPYGGPTISYATGTNMEFLSDNIKDAATSKCYGITMACENLASFAVASRGTNPFPRFGVEAGSVASKLTKDAGGKWFIAKAAEGAANAPPVLEEVPAPDGTPHAVPGYLTGTPNEVRVDRFGEQVADDAYFGPGSVLLFSNRPAHPNDPAGFEQLTNSSAAKLPFACRVEAGLELCAKRGREDVEFTGPFRVLTKPEAGRLILADHTAGAHIAPVLRISPDRKKIQTLDTGGLSVAGRDSGSVSILGQSGGFHSGNLDDALTDRVKSVAGEPMRGVGAFARITSANKAAFETQLKALLKARPLGFVRLALMPAGTKVSYQDALNPAGGWLLFLSPLLPMYGAQEHENFHITRYLWSLRDAPGCGEGVEAWWLFYVPRGGLAREMMKASARGKTAAELAGGGDVAGALLKAQTLPIMNAKVTPGGHVAITCNKINKQGSMHRIHYAEGNWSGSQLPMDKFFSIFEGTLASAFPPEIVPPGTPQITIVPS